MKMNLILLFATLFLRITGIGGQMPRPALRHASPQVSASVQFSIRNAGLPLRGTLDGIRADVSFHPDNLSGSRITATADPATLRTGIGIRDKHLQRPDFFDAANHPRIQLASTAFRKTGRNAFLGRFALTITGITKTVALPFTRSRTGGVTTYRGHFEMNRLDFNLGEESSVLDEKVTVFVVASVQE